MISDIRERVKQFLEEVLELKQMGEIIRIIGVVKTDDGWVAKAEVVERSRLLPQHQVFEKKYYIVKLDSNMEIYSYKPAEEKEHENIYEM